MSAKTKPQETLSAGEVGGPEASRTTVLALKRPPTRGERRLLEGDGAAAEAILEFLIERRLL
jgi:hypothetical protein